MKKLYKKLEYNTFLHAVIPSMLKVGLGSIVNSPSLSDIVAVYAPSLAYMARKFAVCGMTERVVVMLGSKNLPNRTS